MLGIVFGLERFHHYAYGRHVTVETDHEPLESITRKNLTNAPPRLMRMLLRIQKYDFTVKYVPGKDIPIADGLSRLPIHGDEMPDINVTIHDITGVSESRLEKTFFWNTSCAETKPNGRRRKQYRPHDVLNVVSSLDSSSSFTFQYQDRASSIVKTLAPCSCGSMSSITCV